MSPEFVAVLNRPSTDSYDRLLSWRNANRFKTKRFRPSVGERPHSATTFDDNNASAAILSWWQDRTHWSLALRAETRART